MAEVKLAATAREQTVCRWAALGLVAGFLLYVIGLVMLGVGWYVVGTVVYSVGVAGAMTNFSVGEINDRRVVRRVVMSEVAGPEHTEPSEESQL